MSKFYQAVSTQQVLRSSDLTPGLSQSVTYISHRSCTPPNNSVGTRTNRPPPSLEGDRNRFLWI